MNEVTRKISLTALLSTLALLAFMLENLFPPLFLPGAKMGISNVFILLAALLLGGRYAVVTLLIKVVLGSLFSGNVSSIMYSLPSGIIALSIELALIYLTKNVSIICISIVGAVINVTLQNVTFCLVTNASEYLSLLPYLALISVAAGFIVGAALRLVVTKLPLLNDKINQSAD